MKIWIRADASRSIGLGHIKRCLTIAEEARRRSIPVRFVISQDDETSLRLLEDAEFPVTQVPFQAYEWLADLQKGDLLLVDGYHLTKEIESATELEDVRVACFDDFDETLPPVDFLLMPSLTTARTARATRSQVLVGPRFAPVAPQFVSLRRPRWQTADSLVVTLGSSDPAGLAPIMLSTIASSPGAWDVVLLVGPGMPEMPLPNSPRFSSTVHQGDIAPFFDRFDAAIAAAGTTTWELLCMGIPTVLIVSAENQRRVVQTAVSAGAALYGGDARTIARDLPAALVDLGDPACRRRLSIAGLELVDGRGAERIVEALLT